jgi:calcium-translocating P-type ATPase
MRIDHISSEEALCSLHSGHAGLAGAEAERRLKEFGPNRVAREPGASMTARLLGAFTHFFALILWLAAGLAFLAEWQDPGGGMATLGVAILGVILVNGLFSCWQEYRAERAMAALQQLLPHCVQVVRNGKVHRAPAEALVPGDVILLDGGEDVPADCRLIEAFGVRVNNATVTGESVPQLRDANPNRGEDLSHSRNILLAGTSVVAGQARAVVFATGMQTAFGRIAQLTQAPRQALSPLQREIARLSRLVALLSLGLGGAFFLVGRALGLSFWHNLLFAVGVIVANVPEGLLPTVTLALALASQRMARKNALIRHLPSVETLGSATVICTDKTGTLTQNRMAVKKLFLVSRFWDASALDQLANLKLTQAAFFEAARHCHTLKEIEQDGRSVLQGDPLEVGLVQLAGDDPAFPSTAPPVDEIPFDAERRRLSTLHRTACGLVLYTKGALEALLPLCRSASVGRGERPLDEPLRKEFLHAEDVLAAEGLRVLAVAYRAVQADYQRDHLEEGLTLCGLVGFEDPARPEVPAAIACCREAGIRVVMVTGDHPHTAQAIARQIGLVGPDGGTLFTGEQVRRMSAAQLQLALDRPHLLFARVDAEQKMRIVVALRAKGHVVAVTGDGVNDAPALRQADIGVAMGRTGTDVARAAADMVLLDDNFASIVAAIEEGRAVFANIRKFFTYILTHNVPELVPYLAFVLFRVPPALTVLQILAIDLGTDMLPAIALGSEPPEPEAMSRPPRSPHERLVDGSLLTRSYLFLGPFEALAAMTAFFFVLGGAGWTAPLALDDPLYQRATTACLSAIIAMQIVNVFLCRSERAPALSFPLGSNRLILAGILAEAALLLGIAYTTVGNQVFGTAPLLPSVWLVLVPFVLGLFVLEELRKAFVRRGMRPFSRAPRAGAGHASCQQN